VVASHKGREERVMVLELMVVLFGGEDGFWRRIQKEVMMMVILEVEIKVMDVVL